MSLLLGRIAEGDITDRAALTVAHYALETGVRGVARGTFGAWVALKLRPEITIHTKPGSGSQMITSSKFKGVPGRLFHADYHPLERGGIRKWHFNADEGTGLLSKLNHKFTKMPTALRYSKAIGKATVILGIGLDALDIGSSIKADRDAGYGNFGPNTRHAVGRVSGGWSGAIGGAIAGGTIGSAVPVVGTAAGALIGGIAGAIGGSVVGEWIASWWD